MKVFLFGKHRQLFCETTNAVWWNDHVLTETRLLEASPTTVRLERLSYFHQHKITAFGVVIFLITFVTAALLCSTLDVSVPSCLLMMFAYSFLFAPLLLSLFGPLPLHHEDRWFDFVAAFKRERDTRFSYWAELLKTKLSDPLAVVVEQTKTYQKLTAVLTFVLVPVGSALLGAAVGGGLNDVGYVVLFVWLLLLLVSTMFVFCPHYWLTQIKAKLEKRK